jgi:hypothetical protein
VYRACKAVYQYYLDSPPALNNDNTDNSSDDDTADNPPTGSRPIDQTPWSGDHQEIKQGTGAGPADNVRIDPDGNVWVENNSGSWTNYGPASDYTNSSKPSGQRGKDRGKPWQ